MSIFCYPLTPREQQPRQLEVERSGDLQVLGWRRHDDDAAPRTLHQPGVVGGLGQHRLAHVECPLQGATAKHLRGLHRPQTRPIERPRHRESFIGLLDGVGHGRGRNRAVDAFRRNGRQRGVHQLRGEQWSRGVVYEHRIPGAGRRQGEAHRLRAHRAAPNPDGPGGSVYALRQSHHDPLDCAHRSQRRPHSTAPAAAPRVRRAPWDVLLQDARRVRRQRSTRRPSGATWLRLRAGSRPSWRAARRGSSRPLPRPCRART